MPGRRERLSGDTYYRTDFERVSYPKFVPLNQRIAYEIEEDQPDFVLDKTRELVKVNLSGLGDGEIKDDIAVLDRLNQFLLTPEHTDTNDASQECERGTSSHDSLLSTEESSDDDVTKSSNPKQCSNGSDNLDGRYEIIKNCPWRVIYVKEACDKFNTISMTPTVVVRGNEDRNKLTECRHRQPSGRKGFKWRRDAPLSVRNEGNNEMYEFCVARDTISSSSEDDDLQNPTRYVVIQGDCNTLTSVPKLCFDKQRDVHGSETYIINKNDIAGDTESRDTITNLKNRFTNLMKK